ncbi:metacaspase-5-like [Lotus japonicus]|uniref:metacaspase-5-like n=1 Tax=Lotus japonicus TaxID=34305 RepID=UPI002590A42D|nr:metacaspase-5-like [Lotus japonicus]
MQLQLIAVSTVKMNKKAVLIGLKHTRMDNVDDVKGKILRMKKFLMDLRGFSENNITLLIEDGEEDETQPTHYNIRMETFHLVDLAKPGDVLFIHLIAHGCSDGYITTSDKVPIPDCHFKGLLRNVRKGCALTIVSDCLIQHQNDGVFRESFRKMTHGDTLKKLCV